MSANGPWERLANTRNIRLVTYLLKVRMRSRNILFSLKQYQSQRLWCQCTHDDLDDRVSAVECGRLRFLPKHEAHDDIGQQPAKQRVCHGIEVHVGDDLLLAGLS